MIRTTLVVVSFCLLAGNARGQQIASVDLAHPTESTKPVGKHEKNGLPKGCDKLLPGVIADGGVFPPDNEPREIVVEMVSVNSQNLSVGGEVQGEVRLRNSGEYSIRIPWSTDPDVMFQGQDPNHLSWELGNLTVNLKGTGQLKTLSQSLYGSKYVAGSMLTIRPGEWVSVEINFKLEPEYPFPGQIVGEGEGQLYAEWEQTATTWGIHNCAVGSGFFRYDSYYHQQNPTLPIKVK